MKRNIAKKLVLTISPLGLCMALLLGLSGCHTVHGVGQDVSSVGHAVSGAADHNRRR